MEVNVPNITEQEVAHVAKLARLRLSETELAAFTRQLGDIVGYVERLNELNTDAVDPTAHSVSVQNVLRVDEPRASIPADRALANAPESADGMFRVPKVLDHEGN